MVIWLVRKKSPSTGETMRGKGKGNCSQEILCEGKKAIFNKRRKGKIKNTFAKKKYS